MKAKRFSSAERLLPRWLSPNPKNQGTVAVENAIEVDPSLGVTPDDSDSPGRSSYIHPETGDRVFMD